MGNVIVDASTRLIARHRVREKELADAKALYSRALLQLRSGPKRTEELVAAMDLLEISGDDLNRDFELVKRIRRVERDIAQADAQLKASLVDVREAELNLHEAQGQRYEIPLKAAHDLLQEVAEYHMGLEARKRELHRELESLVKQAPRVFCGFTRMPEESRDLPEAQSAAQTSNLQPQTATDQ